MSADRDATPPPPGNAAAGPVAGDVELLLGLLPALVVLIRALAPAAQSPEIGVCRAQLADEAHAVLGLLLEPGPIPAADRATLVGGLTSLVGRLRRCPCREAQALAPAFDSIERWLVRLAALPDHGA